MKSEDTRNLFLAIALSVLVMAGWQYFYAGPLYQRQHQAQMEANQTQATRLRRARSAAERLARQLRRPRALAAVRRRRRPAPRLRQRPQTVSAALAASPRVIDRHAEHRRLDRPQGRQDRRHHPQGLSRDDRPEEPEHPAVLAAGRARRLLGRDRVCKPGRQPRLPISTRSGPPIARR